MRPRLSVNEGLLFRVAGIFEFAQEQLRAIPSSSLKKVLRPEVILGSVDNAVVEDFREEIVPRTG